MALDNWAAYGGVDTSTSTTPAKEEKPLKNGTYVSTQTSSRIPDDLALTGKINTVFKKFYGRDASDTELEAWLPELRKQYVSKNGKSKTTVKQTYKNGQLISTDYLTAEGQDPAEWAENKIKQQVLTGNQPVNDLNILKVQPVISLSK